MAGHRRGAVVVLVVLGLTGCGGEGPAPPPTAPAALTRVLTFQAYDDVGLLPNLVRAATVAGACQGGSVVHAGRADAWRCRAGETVYDPCFASSTGEELACVPDPWAREVTTLRPPAPLGRAGQNRNDPGLPPWFLELADGARCGRAPPSGYRCSAGGDVGEPDTARPAWTVPAAGGVTREVATAWY